MSRSRLLLLLLLALGLALTYAWRQTPRLQRSTGSVGVSSDKSSDLPDGQSGTVSVSADLLFSAGEETPYKPPKRDLFRPLYEAPPPVAPVVIAPPPLPEPAVVRLPPPVVTPPAVLQRTGRKPIPPLKVLGYLQKGATQTAFLSSAGGEIYVVKRGDRFADDLLVRELTADIIQISRDLTDKGVTLYFAKENARLKAAGPLVSDRPSFTPEEEPPVENINPQMPFLQEQPNNDIGKKTVEP